MDASSIDPKVKDQLEKLEAKYAVMGQDLSSYLDGLLYADYLTYWDYIHLDTLLSLQSPRTDFPDEQIFIIYHQITELYFRLILLEQQQAIHDDHVDADVFLKRLNRMNRYFDHLINSFDVMIDGMDQSQFLAFRMSLLPSSGFQSGQYRKIEINATDFYCLANTKIRSELSHETPLKEVYEHLYWKRGATELKSGKKTLTLRQFEKKYGTEFLNLAESVRDKNLYRIYLDNYSSNLEISKALKQFDHRANVLWPLAHFKSAAKYLQRDPDVIKATGGTNWQQYLPPRKQMIVFYPELWSEDELENWGTTIK
ncbi:MAG: tryptophan 2,3-dioxygenase [Cyclobacteriaceae bacterium]|jgi:tryptophan 2,3-dioxygenase